MAIRVYLIEDHEVMRDALTDYLTALPDMDVCGFAESAEQAELDLDGARPEIVLLDLSLPGRSGLEFLSEAQARWRLPCVVLSGHGEPSHVRRALAAGARGYVLKGTPTDVPIAIRDALDGRIFLSDALRGPVDQDSDSNGT